MNTSNQLAEAFRAELRQILEADGRPFTPALAFRLSRLADVAHRALALTGGAESAIEAIRDDKTPTDPDDDVGQTLASAQASETFGVTMVREIMATLPLLLSKNQVHDPRALVQALAEARTHDMPDVVERLELKLLGYALEKENKPEPVICAPPAHPTTLGDIWIGETKPPPTLLADLCQLKQEKAP